jgi:hypothetical protein
MALLDWRDLVRPVLLAEFTDASGWSGRVEQSRD